MYNREGKKIGFKFDAPIYYHVPKYLGKISLNRPEITKIKEIVDSGYVAVLTDPVNQWIRDIAFLYSYYYKLYKSGHILWVDSTNLQTIEKDLRSIWKKFIEPDFHRPERRSNMFFKQFFQFFENRPSLLVLTNTKPNHYFEWFVEKIFISNNVTDILVISQDPDWDFPYVRIIERSFEDSNFYEEIIEDVDGENLSKKSEIFDIYQ